ncbi:MAG: Lnb N-terminal periplasmic domain-containing protein [Alphaproteobacteria bacterium]
MKWVIFFFYILFSMPIFASVENIIFQIEQKKLWEDPQWQTLLHYKNNKSTVDSKSFFFAKDGKINPKEELIETIKSFSNPTQSEHVEKINIRKNITQNFQHQHPQCTFPARFKWLSSQLNLSSIKKQKCPAYQKWLKKVRPHTATLVFASAYLNQPSSLFGHTFLRFDRKNKSEDLLSYISNFGAITPKKPNGLSYAYNGLTGGYPGVFSFQPYYEKVKTYGAIENRDLWEYHLNFSKKELERLVDHVWELGYQYVDYFFFTDNCSYLLMEILDVVRPQMKLADQFKNQTIPLDTVRAVLNQKDLVQNVDFRPSMQTKILHRWKQLSPAEKKAIRSFGKTGKLNDNLTETEAARVIEISYDVMQYDLAKGKIGLENMRPKSMTLLHARNKINTSATLFSEISPPIRPDFAHHSSRVSVLGGIRDSNTIASVSFRPAYHTINDLDDGHVFGAGLNFFHGEIQYDFDQQELYLNQFDLVSITSFSPWQATFRPTSWKLGIGLSPRPNDCNRQMGNAFGAVGISFKLMDKFLIHTLAEGQVNYADNTFSKNPLVGAGASVGFVWAFLPKWKIVAETKMIQFSEKKDNDFYDTKSNLVYFYSKNTAYTFEVRHFKTKIDSFNEMQIGIKKYF